MCREARDYMKDFSQYGNRPDDQWEMLPWIPDPRPPFKIWVKPEQIAPFFLIPHHPYAISLLLKISDGFRTEEFCRLGLTGSSGDWERLVRGVIQEFEEGNSGEDLFHFDSDEDVFCVYSQYIDDDVSEHERGSESMKELTTQTGIIVKCSKTAIEFFQNAQSVDSFSVLEIPGEFQDIAVEFYDLIMENDHLAALLGCRGNYDIAVQIDEVTGTMTGWHWFK